MGTGADILATIEHIDTTLAIPRVRSVWIPEPTIAADKDAEFGVIELEDGSAGLFYAWLGESQAGISARYVATTLAGQSAIALARYFAGGDDMARSIGLAAINAITQSLFTRARYEPPLAENSMAGLELAAGDRLGMIGNFPSLVRQAGTLGVPVTVVERKPHMVRESRDCVITLDPLRLAGCNKIICTAATLINDTIDDMLAYCRGADVIAVLGPSASFPPEPLFDRGISIVGGSRVSDAAAAIAMQQAGKGLRGCSRRYVIERSAWPGTAALLARAAA
jgi:uncharacterized protein (DUF4213/DUF364 family)